MKEDQLYPFEYRNDSPKVTDLPIESCTRRLPQLPVCPAVIQRDQSSRPAQCVTTRLRPPELLVIPMAWRNGKLNRHLMLKQN
jgi:hypothetical protein